ncbi:MAG: hypothetical protein HQL59_12595 [Magnetococcales bacterium]|nr:hypothetical protein [Magnetococcales bacterium]
MEEKLRRIHLELLERLRAGEADAWRLSCLIRDSRESAPPASRPDNLHADRRRLAHRGWATILHLVEAMPLPDGGTGRDYPESLRGLCRCPELRRMPAGADAELVTVLEMAAAAAIATRLLFHDRELRPKRKSTE